MLKRFSHELLTKFLTVFCVLSVSTPVWAYSPEAEQIVADSANFGGNLSPSASLSANMTVQGVLELIDGLELAYTDRAETFENNVTVEGDLSVNGLLSNADVIANSIHRTSDGSDHTFIDQSVTTTASPTFVDETLTGSLQASQHLTVSGTTNLGNGTLYADHETGNTGLGTTNPSAKLDVNGAIKLSGTDNIILNNNWLSGDGGDEGVYVTSTGNVGIGVTNPLAKLDVDGDLSVGDHSLFVDQSATSVGIGTSSPSSKLHINGTVGALSGGLAFGDGDTGLYESSDDNLRIKTLGSDRVTITSSGNVGIGTTSPGVKLEIRDTTAGTDSVLNIYKVFSTSAGDMADGFGSGLLFGIADGGIPGGASIATIAGVRDGGDTQGALIFKTRASGEAVGGLEKVRITGSGNVGIGTVSPSTKLDVLGNASVSGNLSVAGNLSVGGNVNIEGITFTDGGLELSGAIDMNNNLITNIGAAGTDFTSGGGLNLASQLNAATNVSIDGNLSVGVSNLVVTSGGNVGIGTTSPAKKLAIVGSANNGMTVYKSDGTTILGTVSGDSTEDGQLILKNSDGNTRVYLNTRSSDSYFYNGFAVGANYTGETAPTSGMIIEGNVGIGTTSPKSKLYVNGNTSLSGTLTVSGDSFLGGQTMFVDQSSGNVGIGTTSPEEKLEVKGTMKVHSSSVNDRGVVMRGNWNSATDNGITFTSYGYEANGTYRFDNQAGNLMTIDVDGNVGIGTTTPTALLDLSPSGATGGLLIDPDQKGYTGDLVRVNTVTTTGAFVVTEAGNVGIGTKTPDEQIEIFNGNIKMGDNANVARYIILERSGATLGLLSTANSRLSLTGQSNADVFISDDSSNGIMLKDGGNIGIGTTSPTTAKLVVNGAVDVQGGQIIFPASQSASAGANTLDDYEEGTWTPVLGGAGGTSGQTYSFTEGIYTKVGKLVFFSAYIYCSDKGTITGNLQLQGLPFTSGSSNGYYSAFTIGYAKGIDLSAAHIMVGQVNKGTATGSFYEQELQGDVPSILTTTQVSSTVIMEIAGVYMADN